MKRVVLVLSCEHGGADVPAPYRRLFRSDVAKKALATHRGSDPGALSVAERLASALNVPLISTTVSRLLVDTNRSEHHPRLFSAWSSQLSPEERETVLDQYYRPHRARIAGAIAERLRNGARVLHVAVHSFTPVLDGEERRADVGLLYDPRRSWEQDLARTWQSLFALEDDALRVRRNYPYRGIADGLTTALRKAHGAARYAGIELELGQALVGRPGAPRTNVARAVEATLRALLTQQSTRLER
jgi:predicted N-formylglutamate amidohydrolase